MPTQVNVAPDQSETAPASALSADPNSKIKVNGRTRVIKGDEITFEELVKLAFPSGPTKPNTKFTITFRNAAQVPAMGELDPGQSVKVKSGRDHDDETVFNVTETVLS